MTQENSPSIAPYSTSSPITPAPSHTPQSFAPMSASSAVLAAIMVYLLLAQQWSNSGLVAKLITMLAPHRI